MTDEQGRVPAMSETWAKRFLAMSYEDRVMTIVEDGSTLDALIAEALNGPAGGARDGQREPSQSTGPIAAPAPAPTPAPGWPHPCRVCGGDGGHEAGCPGDRSMAAPEPTPAGRETELRQAFEAGFTCCSTQTSGESLDDEFQAWLAALRGGQP